jgi:hypothetical protein
MRFLYFILISCSIFCCRPAVEIKTVEDVDFNRFTTFRVDKGEIVTLTDQPINDDFFYNAIKEGVVASLVNKGYTFVEDSSAQLAVTYVGEAVVKLDTQDLGPLGQTPADQPNEVMSDRTWAREHREGSLILEVTDAATKKMVWRASSTVEYNLTDTRSIRALVHQAFRKFPERTAGKK